ncbi:hypothetical protein J4573_17590 [Actinomadura barringtoniae]|uniref:Uncharacterized protein n=1 Tax=Actinomadura barringtoniae TaxID=1427535 RepID=A0A939PAE3_9ACTN|nr:hypothetical protein [Actinomadura barringtoniae]MBO2448920.1 hypothetical protein [Actinomadura barringtoniae]
MTSRIDGLVADLASVRDDDITSEPLGSGGKALLTAITAAPAPTPAPTPTTAGGGLLGGRRRAPRVLVGAVAVAGAAAAVVVGMGGSDSGPLRSYANAAVSVHATGRTYEVEVKDAYADQRKFAEAFAKVGLDARLRIVPAPPGAERTVLQENTLHEPKGGMPPGGLSGTSTSIMKCPPGEEGACPLKVRLGGEMFLREGADIIIGRKARPGELYWNVMGTTGDRPKSLHLTGRTAAQALKDLRRRGFSVAFMFGTFKPDGSGQAWDAPPNWRPAGERRVTGAWMRSSNSVGLMLLPIKNDPQPRPFS